MIKIQQFSFKKNAFENVAWKMVAILSLPQCINHSNMTHSSPSGWIINEGVKVRADELTFKFFILEKFVSVYATVVFFIIIRSYNCFPYDFMKKWIFVKILSVTALLQFMWAGFHCHTQRLSAGFAPIAVRHVSTVCAVRFIKVHLYCIPS